MRHTGSRPRRFALTLIVCTASIATACTASSSSDSGDGALRSDSLTRRQKDSIVSTLPVPGAGAVGRALDASDLARERALAHDTLF